MLSKDYKDSTRKKKNTDISLINIDAKYAKKFKNILKTHIRIKLDIIEKCE